MNAPEKPIRIEGDPEGYEPVFDDGKVSCMDRCALAQNEDECGFAPCLKESRPQKVFVYYIKEQGEK